MTTKNSTSMRFVNGNLSFYTPDLSSESSVVMAFVQDSTQFDIGSKCVVKMTPKQAERFINLFKDHVEDYLPEDKDS